MLNLVIALAEEARPFIRHFKLTRYHHVYPFQIYGNDNIQLIVSGIGKMAAATATAYLAGLTSSSRTSAWLNVGIAGGNAAAVGKLVLAHQIVDSYGEQCFYPAICFDIDVPRTCVVSTDKAQVVYQEKNVYDMEAAGFFAAAMRFGTAELIHCIKIISDNNENSITAISRKKVDEWIEGNLQQIAAFMGILVEMVEDIEAEKKGASDYEYLLDKYHFTQSQQSQLKLLLQNWHNLSGSSVVDLLGSHEIKNSKMLLRTLENEINAMPLNY